MDMTTSAQYLEVYVGHRTPNGDLRFVFGETAFGVPDQHVPGRFRLDYACPDSPPFQSIDAISFKFAEIGDDAVLALDAFRLTTQSVYPTTSSQLSPQGLSAMNTILELQKKMLEDLETRICAAVDLQLNQVLQRLDAAEAIVDDLTTRVDSIHQDKDIVFAGIMHRLNNVDTGIIQLRSAQVQTTKAVQSAIQNVKQSVAAQRNSQSDADDSSSLSTSSLHSVQWQQLNPSPP
ncbi:hypothetical protein DYB32_004713 [Aphanomyces invadans]|uniref:Uncharacterized protein n=1 Tax=Aphanomyces invadans TaxID=157072 RepID=A0A3R6YZA1_9STRA|nr:hypothetical protein DYB32_004713 [Aphanomyces invadans]